jgi:hypothetical protein
MNEKELRERQNAEIRRREGLEDATCTDPACNGFKCNKRYHLMAYMGNMIVANLTDDEEKDAGDADSLESPRPEDTAKQCPPNCPECTDASQEQEDYFPARHPPIWAESLPPGATKEDERRAQLQWQIKCLQWLLDRKGENPEGIDEWCNECGCPQYYCHSFAPPFSELAVSGSLTGLDDLEEGHISAAVPATKSDEFVKQVCATDLGENGDALLTMRDDSVVRVHDLRRDGVTLRHKDSPITVHAHACWDRVPKEALPEVFYGSSPLGLANCRCQKKA